MFKLFKRLRKQDWLSLVLVLTLIIVQVWLDLKVPDYTMQLTASVSGGTVTMRDVWYNGGFMLLCSVGSMIAAFICGYLISRIASAFAFTLRTDLFAKTTSFSSTEMKKFSIPSLITRTTNDVSQVQMFLTIGLQMLIKAPIMAVWAITKISTTSIEWTMATLITVFVIVVSVGLIVGIALPRFKRIQTLTDNLNDATRENVTGVRVVRAFNAENYQEKKFEKANNDMMKNSLFTTRAIGLLNPVMTFCMNGLTLAIYWIGAILVNRAEIAERATVIGNMTAFTQYALQVVMAFMMLIIVFIFLPRAIVSAKRINEVLGTENKIVEGTCDGTSTVQGEVEFKNVAFKYADGAENVFSDVSFKARKGETIAIIGATGSGKSTLIDLIPRFYDVTAGEVLVDGINVKEYRQEDLQNKIAVVSQKACLFKGDIQNNITYGTKDSVPYDDPRIQRALDIAQADFVKQLKQGVRTEVAQGGTNFSGGQKQRLSIARAIFKDAEILIFDDSFSALDYKTDMLVRKAIKEQLTEKTVFIVAQRIGTIRNADKILVLDNGKIVGQGKHAELMKNCPVYKEIALSQLSKEEL